MKKALSAVLLALVLLAAAPRAFCADAKTELEDVVSKVKAKLEAGKPTEQDLAPELAGFDTILAEHKGEKTDDVAHVLFMKAMLYAQVLDDDSKATAELQEVKAEFPNTADARSADRVIASLASQEEAKKIQRGLAVGSQFPDFTEKDLNGQPLSVANDQGKIVLIDFWATWCGPCVHELPNVQKIYAQDHDKGFDIIGISLDQDKDKLTSFIKEKNMTWPQYFDGKGWENKLSTKYGVNSIPATYLIARTGKIIGKDLRGDDSIARFPPALAAK